MSLMNKLDVPNHAGAPRMRYSVLTIAPASESDATGNSSAEDYIMFEKDELTEASAVLVEKSKTRLTSAK